MPDILDTASEVEELHRRAALANVARAPAIAATGSCLNCGDQVGTGMRWCDADCRDDWQRDRNRK